MAAKKRAALVAERLRAAAVAPIAATVADEIKLKQATPRAHAAPLPTWDVPHVAGRLDARHRISLNALHGCPDTDLFDVSFNGPWIVLTPTTSRSPRGRCGLEDPQEGRDHSTELMIPMAARRRVPEIDGRLLARLGLSAGKNGWAHLGNGDERGQHVAGGDLGIERKN